MTKKHFSLKVSVLLFVITIFSKESCCQSIKDTIDLKEIVINSKNENYHLIRIDTSIINKNLAVDLGTLLSKNTPIFIKTFGQGNLTTMTVRGSGASHTQIYWNSVNINSPMLGHFDLSLLPICIIDELDMSNNGNFLKKYPSSIGGTILLKQKPSFNKKFSPELVVNYGSFETVGTIFKGGYSNSKSCFDIRTYYNYSKNNFKYKNNSIKSSDFPIEERKDASYLMSGIQVNYWYLTKIGMWNISTWAQNFERAIPQPIIVKPLLGNEKLLSNVIFFNSSYMIENKNYVFNTNVGFKYDYMKYTNKISSIYSDNFIYSGNIKIDFEKNYTKKITAVTSLYSIYDIVKTQNYKENLKNRLTNMLLIQLKYNYNNSLNLLFSGEITEMHNDIYFSPSINIEKKLITTFNSWLFTSFALKRHHPTFNDLYWYPGGNPNLKSEKSKLLEMGYYHSFSINKVNSVLKVSYYTNNVKDWISWLPDTQFRYWTAKNYKEVIINGVECYNKIEFIALNRFTLGNQLNYSLTYAKNISTYFYSDDSKNKQLIYVPQNCYNTWFYIKYKRITAEYGISYIGKRYTSTDNKRYLPEYYLNDFKIGIYCFLKKVHNELILSINNLWNIDYHVISWHPMPGRNYSLNLRFYFK